MTRVCQGLTVLLAVATLARPAGAESKPSPPPEQPRGTKVSVAITAWEQRSFADVILADPELAACVLLSPGWWVVATPPAATSEPLLLTGAMEEQVLAAMGAAAPATLSVILAAADVKVPAAVTFGRVTLALRPVDGETTAPSLGQAVASSLVAASSRPAAPDARCGEPLLALGEAFAAAGSASLATLPAALRPVRDWLEADEAEPVLAALAKEALEEATPWPSRRARLQAAARPEGASRDLAHAAALLVETFGDPGHARAVPFELLSAWRTDAADRYPAMPRVLKRALARPLDETLATDAPPAEREALTLDVLSRALAHGAVPDQPPAGSLPLATRLLAAAIARSQGHGACHWITAEVPGGLRTGCRAEGETGGFVYSRPRPTGDFEIIARAAGGEEGVLLRWPGWVLFPVVDGARGELLFVDAQGVQGIALDGRTPPRTILAGAFRHLTLTPDARHMAAVRWPAGTVVVTGPEGPRELAVDGRGGVAWLENDVLVASDREKLALASTAGQVRPLPAAAPCVVSLARSGTGLLATTAAPCEPVLLAITPADWRIARLARLPETAVGIVARPDGSILFGDAIGLWRWSGGDQAERVGAGLTPGPG